MDRRRFIPPSLGFDLERRQLLATTAGSVIGIGNTTAATSIVDNLALRHKRIDHLPFILDSFAPGRALPTEVTQPIQDDLRAIISTLHSPGHSVLESFNRTVRAATPDLSLSPQHAQSLIDGFDNVLRGAGADDVLRAKFVADMTSLAKLDSSGPKPAIQAINDFGTITQLTVAVGRPFDAPGATTLNGAEKIDKRSATYEHRPVFIGAATAGTVIQIIDSGTSQVIASGVVPTNNTYSIRSFASLADGSHTVFAQTVDGPYVSVLSRPYTFKVFTRQAAAPQGPRG